MINVFRSAQHEYDAINLVRYNAGERRIGISIIDGTGVAVKSLNTLEARALAMAMIEQCDLIDMEETE